MFSCFNIDLREGYSSYVTNYYSKGLQIFNKNKLALRNALENYIDDTGSIDGSKLQDDWFRTVEADVFISHSHKDVKTAIALAGWLNYEMGLSSFIDSCLWGYSDDLLKEINDKYNIKKIEDDGTKTYYHNKANYASSHVHMMLCTALNKMLQHCESIFFLNTENSLINSEYSADTNSPWIYLETCLANTIEKEYPQRLAIIKHFSEKRAINESTELTIKYHVDIEQFIPLDNNDLKVWKNNYENDGTHSLDVLYKMCNIPIK